MKITSRALDLAVLKTNYFEFQYAMEEDTELSAHFDNAEITLNVSLSKDFQGGELVFNDLVNPSLRFGYEHEFSYGILHRGCHNHQALPISFGERWNLIGI